MSTQISLSRPIKLEVNVTPITGGSAGQILFQTTGNTVGESANLFWDNTNGRLGVGGTPSETLDVKGSATSGYNAITFKSQYTSVGYLGGDNSQIFMSSAPSGGGSYLYLNSSNTILNAVQNIRFLTGSTERARIAITTGNVLIGTTTDAGYKLDLNGTARFTGAVTTPAAVFSDSSGTSRITLVGAGGGLIGTNCYLGTNAILGFNLTTSAIGSVSIGGNFNAVASAILDIRSTTKGFLPPRMTTTEKNAIATPATGLMVYDTTLNLISVYNGTTWISL